MADPTHAGLDLLFALHTTTWVLFAGLLSLPPGRWGRIGFAVTALATAIAGLWLAASAELHLFQGRPLTAHELLYRLADPPSRPFLRSQLLDWRPWTLLAGLLAGHWLLARLLRYLPAGLMMAVWIAAVTGIKVGATAWVLLAQVGTPTTYRGMRLVYAPWHPILREWSPPLLVDVDEAAARRYRADPAMQPFAAGGDSFWAAWQGRYAGRSAVVVVVLESHRLSDIAPWGHGAWDHEDLSPAFTRWAVRGIACTGYIASGQHSQTMSWSMLTGTDNHPRCDLSLFTPIQGRFGPARALADAGWTMSWLQSTPTSFADLDRVLMAADVEYALRPQEQARTAQAGPWGMDDLQLLASAQERMAAWQAAGHRYLLVAETVSNHVPFNLPDSVDGLPLSRDHRGGMRFADRALDRFLTAWQALPEADRPLVLVTADHTHREGLADAPGAGTCGLESLRLPGLLLLPDGERAGATWDGLVNHADAIDLLAFLTMVDGGPAPWKWTTHHRIACPVARSGVWSLVTTDTLWCGERQEAWIIDGYWRLAPADPVCRERLQALLAQQEAMAAQVWRLGGQE